MFEVYDTVALCSIQGAIIMVILEASTVLGGSRDLVRESALFKYNPACKWCNLCKASQGD